MSHDELWDDTLLIQQYDAAMDHVKHKVFKQEGSNLVDLENDGSKDTVMMQYSDEFSGDFSLPTLNNKKKKRKNRRKLEWQVGTACRCKYAKDGQMYEATITQLEINSPYATVTFVGYENSERVPLVQLYRSKGNAVRTSQEKEAAALFIGEGESSMDQGNSSSTSEARDSSTCSPPSGPQMQHRQLPHMDLKDDPLLDFPPHPPGLGLPAGPDSEALHTMLLSWYMTGYHTGYYRGVTASQRNTLESNPHNDRS